MKLKIDFYKNKRFWLGSILLLIFPNLLELKTCDIHFWMSLLTLILGLYLVATSTIVLKNKRKNYSNRH